MKIRVGIIGCGSIANFRHAPEYAANPNVELVAFYDRRRERAEEMVRKYGGRVADQIEEILDDEQIDAISDCSSNENHHIISTMALQKGKHVLCEKPLAVTVEDAMTIIQASKASGKILMVGHNQRFNEAHQHVKALLQSGELGKVLTFKTNFGHQGPESWSATKGNSTWFFKKERSVLGVAGDLGIHKVDLIRYLLDDEYIDVSAYADTLHKRDENDNPIEVCDNMIAIYRMGKGTLGTASFSWTYYGEEDNSTILYCERGIVKMYADPDRPVEVIRANGERATYQVGQMQTNAAQTSSGVIDAFIESIRNEYEPPVTGDDGLISLKVIEASMLSAQTGKSIKIT